MKPVLNWIMIHSRSCQHLKQSKKRLRNCIECVRQKPTEQFRLLKIVREYYAMACDH